MFSVAFNFPIESKNKISFCNKNLMKLFYFICTYVTCFGLVGAMAVRNIFKTSSSINLFDLNCFFFFCLFFLCLNEMCSFGHLSCDKGSWSGGGKGVTVHLGLDLPVQHKTADPALDTDLRTASLWSGPGTHFTS